MDGARCHALGVELKGTISNPTAAEVAAKTYPIVRPISAVIVGRPAQLARIVTNFLISPDGQALLRKSGDMGLDAVPPAPASVYFVK